jgi:hypothetical protein
MQKLHLKQSKQNKNEKVNIKVGPLGHETAKEEGNWGINMIEICYIPI